MDNARKKGVINGTGRYVVICKNDVSRNLA